MKGSFSPGEFVNIPNGEDYREVYSEMEAVFETPSGHMIQMEDLTIERLDYTENPCNNHAYIFPLEKALIDGNTDVSTNNFKATNLSYDIIQDEDEKDWYCLE